MFDKQTFHTVTIILTQMKWNLIYFIWRMKTLGDAASITLGKENAKRKNIELSSVGQI
jgi:hypothetical protein